MMLSGKKLLCILMAMSLLIASAALLVSCKGNGEATGDSNKTDHAKTDPS